MKIFPDGNATVIPASVQQEGVWFHAIKSGAAYWNFLQSRCYKGHLDTGVLKRSLDVVLGRHSALRTNFRFLDGRLYQVVWDPFDSSDVWSYLKFERDDHAYMDEIIRSELAKEEKYDFDYDSGPLIRFRVLAFKRIHFFILTINHIVTDAASMRIFWNELIEYYNLLAAGGEAGYCLPANQYFHYSIAQNNFSKTQEYISKKGYWLDKFSKGLPVLNLSFYVSKADARLFHKNADLSVQLVQDIRTFSLRKRVLYSSVFQLAYFILLKKYSQDAGSIVISNIMSGRGFRKKMYGDVMGLFANQVVNMQQFDEEDTIASLLHKVNTDVVASFDNGDIPHEEIIRDSNERNKTGLAPLAQAVFNMIKGAGTGPAFKGLEEYHDLNYENAQVGNDQYDIGLSVIENIHRVVVRFDVKCDPVFLPVIDHMLQNYVKILKECIYDPTVKVSKLDIVSSEERGSLKAFNDTGVGYGDARTLVDLLDESAMRRGRELALVCGRERLSYAELAERSNRLGHYLRGLGVREDGLVGICVERSVEMVVGILGILKAGGAYVPMEPGYPVERLRYMLSDTEVGIVLSSGKSRGSLPAEYGGQVVLLDEQWESISREPGSLPETGLRADHLAYVLYTSGSTGKPKGVMVEHRNVVNYIRNRDTGYTEGGEGGGRGSYLQLSYTFDASVTSLFLPLTGGGKLVLGNEEDEELFGGETFWENAPYDFLKLTPGQLPLLREQMAARGDRRVARRLVLGGEALGWQHVKGLRGEGMELINEYGPTEATVGCTVHRMDTEGKRWPEGATIPVGRPIGNMKIYILDSRGHLQPVGVAGEIWIGGVQVARGYWHRAELTAERFVPDPFGGEGGQRLYRTGDLGRWLPDGNIEYLGRLDEQVKVRGYRIELGEIESVVHDSGLVRQCVVSVRSDAWGNKGLVGYVVSDGGFNREELINYLRARLPEYMVPVVWGVLDTLPLTVNGKVDKKSLPEVDAVEGGSEYEAPRNELETALAEIWQELLGVERIGIRDNFFALGGDSIISIQVSSRAKRLGYKILARDIFLHQTIGRLSVAAGALSKEVEIRAEQGLLSGVSGLLPMQQRYLEREGDGTSRSHYNQSQLLGIDKGVSEEELRKALGWLKERHDALRYEYVRMATGWQQCYGNATWGGEELQVCDLRGAADGTGLLDEMSSAVESCQVSLSIERGEVMRAMLLRTPAWEQRNRLLLVIHHLSVDGVSWRILLEDLESILKGVRQGDGVDMGVKSSSCRDWYHAMVEYGASRRLSSQHAYWAGLERRKAPLPVDRVYEGKVYVKDRGVIQLKLKEAQTRMLLQEAPGAYHTEINDILLAALARTLCRWRGSNETVIGLEAHGREEAMVQGLDLSRTVGWLTTLYPVMLESREGEEMGDLIRGVKEGLRQLPDKGLGYGVLKYINKIQELRAAEPWEIVFNYLGQISAAMKRSELFNSCGESAGRNMGDGQTLTEKLTINCWISEGELQVQWGYSRAHYRRETMEQLGACYIRNLEELTSHCAGLKKQVYSPSDYGLGGEVGYRELDSFLNKEGTGKTNIMEF